MKVKIAFLQYNLEKETCIKQLNSFLVKDVKDYVLG